MTLPYSLSDFGVLHGWEGQGKSGYSVTCLTPSPPRRICTPSRVTIPSGIVFWIRQNIWDVNPLSRSRLPILTFAWLRTQSQPLSQKFQKRRRRTFPRNHLRWLLEMTSGVYFSGSLLSWTRSWHLYTLSYWTVSLRSGMTLRRVFHYVTETWYHTPPSKEDLPDGPCRNLNGYRSILFSVYTRIGTRL